MSPSVATSGSEASPWGENSATVDGVHAAFAAGARLIVYAGVLTFFPRAICVTRHVATEASSAATTGAPT